MTAVTKKMRCWFCRAVYVVAVCLVVWGILWLIQ